MIHSLTDKHIYQPAADFVSSAEILDMQDAVREALRI